MQLARVDVPYEQGMAIFVRGLDANVPLWGHLRQLSNLELKALDLEEFLEAVHAKFAADA